MKYLTNIVNQVASCKFTNHGDLELKVIEIKRAYGDLLKHFGTPNIDLLWSTTFATRVLHTLFFGPSTTRCLKCTKPLKTHNLPSEVLCFGLNGPLPALKITLQCTECIINYRHAIL